MTKMYGVNKNFESAISACTGDYVMICDQDDIWMPDKIKDTLYKMLEVEELRGGNAILVTSQSVPFVSQIPNVDKNSPSDVVEGYKELLFGKKLFCQGNGMMMNNSLKKVLNPMPEQFADFTYDGYIAMTASAVGIHVHMKQPMLYYRRHPDSVSRTNCRQTFIGRMIVFLRRYTYRFFNTPQVRLDKLKKIIEWHKDEIGNYYIPYYVENMEKYIKGSLVTKIWIVWRMRDIDISRKVKQILLLLLLYPLRLVI